MNAELDWWSELLRFLVVTGLFGIAAGALVVRKRYGHAIVNPALVYNAVVFATFGAWRLQLALTNLGTQITPATRWYLHPGDLTNVFLLAIIAGAVLVGVAGKEFHRQAALRAIDKTIESEIAHNGKEL